MIVLKGNGVAIPSDIRVAGHFFGSVIVLAPMGQASEILPPKAFDTLKAFQEFEPVTPLPLS